MTEKDSEKSVLELIYDWSIDQSLWKRDALRRIFQNDKITDDDLNILVNILRFEKGAKSSEPPETQPLEKEHLPNFVKGGKDVFLSKITNTSNVNKLAPDQNLEFIQTGITVIFGNNGSGKSGYTRILKSTCTARHRSKILPNIYNDNGEALPSSAVISYRAGDGEEQSDPWESSDYPHPVLSAISVFDRECAEIHIGKANEVSFRPLGLDIPEKLVGIFNQVEAKLKASHGDYSNSQNAIFRSPPWQESTEIGQFIAGLSTKNKIEGFNQLSEFSSEDGMRLNELKELIAKDPTKSIKEISNKVASIERLEKLAQGYVERFSDGNWGELLKATSHLDECKKALELAANNVFEDAAFSGIAGDEWRVLWESARKFSLQEAYPEKGFPNIEDDALCVLCHQPLANDAQLRLKVFDDFITSDLEGKVSTANQQLDALKKSLDCEKVNTRNNKGDLEVLKMESHETYSSIYKHLASIRCRQRWFDYVLGGKKTEEPLYSVTESPFESLGAIKAILRTKQVEFQEAATDQGMERLKQERNSLVDKSWGFENRDVVSEEINRLKSMAFIETCLKDTKTAGVTKLGNKLADEAITPQLRDNFLKEINNLVKNKFRVEVVRSGGQAGAPKYKVRLVRSPNKSVPEILSEGEQTCVAIASFFAELSTSEHKSALVFDDPISSLDHKWRVRVAERLAEEAKTRQVVVFTHDLIFLNDLDEAAKHQGVSFNSKHIKSTPELAGLIDDNLPWEGMKLAARIDAMEKTARVLRDERGRFDDESYKRKAREFYSHLRASWERGLEEIALSNTVMRHRDYIKSTNVKNLAALTPVLCKTWSDNFKSCCDYTESHDTSRGRAQELPEPNELLEDVEKLKVWVLELKTTHKGL